MSFQEGKTGGLVVTRRQGQKVRIGDNVYVTIGEIRGNKVRLHINAPSGVSIERDDMIQGKQEVEGK